MVSPAILGLATCTPESEYGQQEIFEFLNPQFASNRYTRVIFRHTGVAYRRFVLDRTYYERERSTRERNETYIEEAMPLGERAIAQCLSAAGLSAQEVTHLIIVSCTGLDTPGLDLRLARQCEMSPALHRLNILAMGCYAALPALRAARDIVLAQPRSKVLLLAIELCSLHFQPGDSTMEQVVSSALFADGAAAVVVGDRERADREAAGPDLLDSATYCDYQNFQHMAFHVTDRGFRMELTADVPAILAEQVEGFVDGLLGRNGLTRDDVRFWGVHPGSKKILDHTEKRLGLEEDALDWSRAVLYRLGNMSSPTVLFVVDEFQRQGRPAAGDWGCLMAFGPGLTMEGALVRW